MRAKTRQRFQFLDSRWSKQPVLHRLSYRMKTLIGGVRCCQMKRKRKQPLETTGKKKTLVRRAVFRRCLKQKLKNGAGPSSPRILRATQGGQYAILMNGRALSTPVNQKTISAQSSY